MSDTYELRCAKLCIGHARADLRDALALLSKPEPNYTEAILALCFVISEASEAIDECAYLVRGDETCE